MTTTSPRLKPSAGTEAGGLHAPAAGHRRQLKGLEDWAKGRAAPAPPVRDDALKSSESLKGKSPMGPLKKGSRIEQHAAHVATRGKDIVFPEGEDFYIYGTDTISREEWRTQMSLSGKAASARGAEGNIDLNDETLVDYEEDDNVGPRDGEQHSAAQPEPSGDQPEAAIAEQPSASAAEIAQAEQPVVTATASREIKDDTLDFLSGKRGPASVASQEIKDDTLDFLSGKRGPAGVASSSRPPGVETGDRKRKDRDDNDDIQKFIDVTVEQRLRTHEDLIAKLTKLVAELEKKRLAEKKARLINYVELTEKLDFLRAKLSETNARQNVAVRKLNAATYYVGKFAERQGCGPNELGLSLASVAPLGRRPNRR